MTVSESRTAELGTPQLSAVPLAEVDLDDVLGLFTEPTFYYRTYRPELLSEDEILALLPERTLVCRAGSRPVGLLDAEDLGAGYPGHYQLYLRFAAPVELAVAAATASGLLDGLRERHPVGRITHEVYEFDEPGRQLALRLGFRDEGVLAGLVERDRRRWGVRYLAWYHDPGGWPLGGLPAPASSSPARGQADGHE